MRRYTAAAFALAASILILACQDENSPTQPAADAGHGVSNGKPAPGDPLPFLSPAQLALFNQGMAVFATEFTPATGLGPLFNSTSCAQCHNDPVLGGYGDSAEVHMTTYTHGQRTCNMLDTLGGPVVQQHATPELQAAMGIVKEPNPPGGTGTGMRTTPIIFGLGLLDAVSDQTIIALSRIPHPEGVHGHPAILPNGRVGRFGRKATVASLDDFNAGAFFNEMGVTSPLNPTEGSVAGTPLPTGVDLAPDPELDETSLKAASSFVKFLAPPSPLPETPETQRGKVLFSQVKCTSCHVPVIQTGPSPIAALRFRKVNAYSDLLLHNLGETNMDGCNGVAAPAEFRTQPLFGMQFLDMFMHDGLSETVDEAVHRHGGEARAARTLFDQLSPTDRAALVDFVMHL
ncbi:MAG TPA: di-heme oxidoredictase family protein [Gemmatimonadales bacterium]|nr:di-heme oxidoredictase family protein [Gemmatimonadales bacterium]